MTVLFHFPPLHLPITRLLHLVPHACDPFSSLCQPVLHQRCWPDICLAALTSPLLRLIAAEDVVMLVQEDSHELSPHLRPRGILPPDLKVKSGLHPLFTASTRGGSDRGEGRVLRGQGVHLLALIRYGTRSSACHDPIILRSWARFSLSGCDSRCLRRGKGRGSLAECRASVTV